MCKANICTFVYINKSYTLPLDNIHNREHIYNITEKENIYNNTHNTVMQKLNLTEKALDYILLICI